MSNAELPYICFVTAPSREVALTLAKDIVEAGLAACVNCVPAVESVYQWRGEINIDTEVLMVIKTEKRLIDALKETIIAEHPYEVPEFIALAVSDISPDYANWLSSNLRK
jgi:periplasmic divalent cation tolerance protein